MKEVHTQNRHCFTLIADAYPPVKLEQRCSLVEVVHHLLQTIRVIAELLLFILQFPGPRSSFNDVALHHCQTRRIGRPYRDAQDILLWKDKTCPART